MNEQQWLKNDELDLWNKKYRNNKESFESFIDRISNHNEDAKKLILEHKFIPGGRILASMGVTDRKVTYSNCYVITPPEDNIESIFECAKKLARTYSYGGGCGIDLSNLRPNGAIVSNASKTSSGPVSFMDMFSQVTGTISQNGRRGALMISMDIRHPDIEEFIDCKTDLSKVNYANISVRVSNEFMEAVEKDDDYYQCWPCSCPAFILSPKEEIPYGKLIKTTDETKKHTVYVRRIKARELFTKLAHNNWDYAEPGILYWDKIENYNMVNNLDSFRYAGTNPCAEEPLPAGGSCLLGALNLSEYVKDKKLDLEQLKTDTKTAIIYLNEVMDAGLPLHPLKEQQDAVKDWRQVGLGTMGLGDLLIKLGIKYGSPESITTIDTVFSNIALSAIEASLELAKEKGAFKGCCKDKLVSSAFVSAVLKKFHRKDLEKEILTYGLRNSQLLTCAPTGSISNLIGVSGGIEPIFEMEYYRDTKSIEENGKEKTYHMFAPIAQEWLSKNPGKSLPEYFVDASHIDPSDRIKVQATVQKWIDASISSTINLPKAVSEKEVFDIYFNSWKAGLKGVTIFRAGCKRKAILSAEKPEDAKETSYDTIIPVSRKTMKVTNGSTFCKKCACGTLYITINRDLDGHIVETFVHTSKGGICQANTNGLNRMVSLALRSGVKVDEIIDQLQGIHCPACSITKAKGNEIDGMSCPDVLAKTLKEFKETPIVTGIASPTSNKEVSGVKCPECGTDMRFEGGCSICPACGYSHCG